MITVPRLELSPATVSVRLDKMIKRELGMTVDRTFFRTDSTSFASGHSGKEYVLSLLRKKFWIIRANSVVCNFLANCISCRRRLAPCVVKRWQIFLRNVFPPTASVQSCWGRLLWPIYGEARKKSSEEVWLYFHASDDQSRPHRNRALA